MAEEYNRYRSMAQEASAKKEQAQEQSSQADDQESYNKYGRMAREALARSAEKSAEREQKAGKRLGGASAANWGWAGAAAIAGIPLTIGKALEYALFGWELDSNGWPKINKQSIAHVDKWHNKVAGIKG